MFLTNLLLCASMLPPFSVKEEPKEPLLEMRNRKNLFLEMGYEESQIDAKVHEVFDEIFRGPDKVYFEVGDSLAYITDIKNNDVRSEGMSYGMMAAVQFGEKDIFDRLWRWSKKYMQHKEGPMEGYFVWNCKRDGSRNAFGAASDGELYFITSLIFASNLWGDSGEINYGEEARRILDKSMEKTGMDRVVPLIDSENQLITFTPDKWGGRFTDPSYHVPAFYEVWAEWAGDHRSGYWRECAQKGREYLHSVVDSVTGLTPDYSAYDGSMLNTGHLIGDAFRYDSWRVPMNVALDYTWGGSDGAWQKEYAGKLHQFFYDKGLDLYADQYNVDGSDVSEILPAGGYKKLRHSTGLVCTLGALSLVSDHPARMDFAKRVWESELKPYEDGYFDPYYDGFMRLFAFMHLSGRYRVIYPSGK